MRTVSITSIHRRAAVVALFIVFALPAFNASAQQKPVLLVEENSVRISNVTPGGAVVLLSCAKFAQNATPLNNAKPQLLRDDDGDGVIIVPGPVPYVSVWIAVDWQTGAVTTGAREGVDLWVEPIAPSLYRKDAEEQIAALEKRILRLMLLVVRPGKGAWALRGREGGDGDRDKEANGKLLMHFEDAAPLEGGKEKAPKNLKAGDVVVAVDLGHFDIFLGEVTK